MPDEKRKTYTTTAVKMKYNNKVYDTISFRAPKELVAQFKEKCAAEGQSQAQIFKDAMKAYLES